MKSLLIWSPHHKLHILFVHVYIYESFLSRLGTVCRNGKNNTKCGCIYLWRVILMLYRFIHSKCERFADTYHDLYRTRLVFWWVFQKKEEVKIQNWKKKILDQNIKWWQIFPAHSIITYTILTEDPIHW